MTIIMYSIYDKKSKTFNGVFGFPSDVNAKRYAEMLCKQPSAIEHNFKDDFALYSFGELDVQTCECLPFEPKLVIDFVDICL